MNIQILVAEVMERHRLTQAQLGLYVGKSQSWVCRALKGELRRLDVEVHERLKKARVRKTLPQ